MGLFGGGSTTYVSSSIYNLAGEEDKRPQYLQTTVINGVLTEAGFSMSEIIPRSYLKGPGIKLRNFANWAQSSGYNDVVGLVTGQMGMQYNVDGPTVAGQIPHTVDETVILQTVTVDRALYSWWADRYMAIYHPELLSASWSSSYDASTNWITILLPDASTESFYAAGFDSNARYLYASYNLAYASTTGPLVMGTTDTVTDFPDTSGWLADTVSHTTHTETLVTTVTHDITYSDSRPAEHDSSSSSADEDWLEIHDVYTRVDYLGSDPGGHSTSERKSFLYLDQDGEVVPVTTTVTTTETIAGGVTKTTVTTTVTDTIELTKTTRTDTQDTVLSDWSNPLVLIYQEGTGNAVLDTMFSSGAGFGTFFPYVPVRINNQFVSDSYLPDAYTEGKRAFRRATTGRLDKIIAKVAENEHLSDIDFTYAIFGVSLNVKEVACREYLYRFLENLYSVQANGASAYADWKTAWNAVQASVLAMKAWTEAQGDSSNPLFGTPAPGWYPEPYPTMPSNSIRISSAHRVVMNFDIELTWNAMIETTGVGQRIPGAQAGDIWFEPSGEETFMQITPLQGQGDTADSVWFLEKPFTIQDVTLCWQTTANQWKQLKIYGLVHRNRVYNGQSVVITAKEALEDTEESGFVVPLHQTIYEDMSLITATQMSTACCFLMFNCYQVVKRKWYQSGWFQVILIIIIIVIAVYTGYTDPNAIGLLGANAAIGAGLGFAGLAAAIVGAIANALAALILVSIVSKVSTSLFGDKIGAIVAFVASILALQAGQAFMNGTSLTASYGSLMQADSLLKLTAGATNAYSNYIQAGAQDALQETQQIAENYQMLTKQIEQMTQQNLGTGLDRFNPLNLTESSAAYVAEPPDVFLSRTLLTGSEIAAMSLDMLTNFVDTTLNLNLT